MKKIFLAALLTLLFTDEVFCAKNFKILKSDQSSIVLELKPFEIWFSEIVANGSDFQNIESDKQFPLLNKAGFPQVPVISVPVGIPFLSNPEVRIIESQYVEIADVFLSPAPTVQIEENENGSYANEIYKINSSAYESASFFPLSLFELSHTQIIRNHKLVKLHLFPVLYNPSQKVIRKYNTLKIEIIFHPQETEKNLNQIQLEKDVFKDVCQGIMVNYPIAKFWKRQENKNKLLRQQFDWYNPEYVYYKMPVSRDGIYHLTYNDLVSSGIQVNDIDSRTLKIFNKGEEIPIRVSGENDDVFDLGDFIEFYGLQNYGEDTFYDDYADTNVYWLTFGGENGKRMLEKVSVSGNFAELLNYKKSVHIEKDEFYYHGDNENIINTKVVSGESWIWKEFFKNEEINFSTYLKDVYIENAELCTLKARLRGITIDAANPDHKAEVSINNNLIGDVFFDNLDDIVYSTTFSNLYLKNGTNEVKIKSIDTGAEINKFYFDWLELSYPATLKYSSDLVTISVSKEQDAKISLWNLQSDSFSVFNLSKNYFISNFKLQEKQRYIFKLLSAGFDDGNYSQVKINSEFAIDGGGRGHNIAVFDTSTGILDDIAWFDVCGSYENSDSMAAYISRIADGKIVLIAICDEGSYSMTEAAHNAMELLGSALTRQVGFRDSYVLLGRKGAEPGTVPELLVKQNQGQAVLVDTLYTSKPGLKHLEFQDQFSTGDEIIIAGIDSMKKPDKIVLDKYSNLKNTDQKVDYIFITHNKFKQTAEKFATYWGAKDYSTLVVDIEEIYDEFNFGIKHVKAIKDFLAFAYQNWKKPAPAYVMLIGDASWDPKKNSQSSVKEDYIPIWGNPVTDNWFVCFDGENDILPDMFVGRLAIETNEEGERIFRKVEKYAALPSESWKKHILFINGGFNDSEQATFGKQSQNIINEFVVVPPSSCKPYVISKELDGLYEGEKREEITAQINVGKLWVNFIGHGGSGTWELMFHDEQVWQLENEDRLPFVTSLTCHTGRFANPEITNFGENFVNYSDAGAIGFTGTSGWGFIYEDEVFAKKLFETALVDTVHQMGAALALSKIKFWGELYPHVRTESVIYQYSLLGDPALKLTLPEIPDITINENEISWLPLLPVEKDSLVEISVKIYNYGLESQDSVQFKVTDNFQLAGPLEIFNQKIKPIAYEDSVLIPVSVKNKPGEHLLNFVIDPENNIIEADETNNHSTASVFVGSSRITVSKPRSNQVVNQLEPILQINNPSAESDKSTYYFELDSTSRFNSNDVIQSDFLPEGTIVTNWQAPQLPTNTIYYWRCRRVENNIEGSWATSNFIISDEFGWTQKEYMQFAENKLNATEITASGIQLQQEDILFRVESSGWDDLNYAIIFVKSTPVATATRGHNIAVCDAYGNFLEFRNFDTHAKPEDVSAMIEFIGKIQAGYFVLSGIADSGEHSMTESAYQALESIGSQYCREVDLRDGWAIIGQKGAPIGSVPEKLVKRFDGVAIVEYTLEKYEQTGSVITTEIGPSNGWNSLSWTTDSLSSETILDIDVIALNKTTLNWDTLLVNLTNNSEESLSAINSKIYPLIKLKADLHSDTKLTTPVLKNWRVTFDPVSDLAVSNKVVKFNSDTLIEGALLDISADVYNVGYITEDSVRINLYFKSVNNEKSLISETILRNLEVNKFVSFSGTWNTVGNVGSNQICFEIDPENETNELSENNNIFTGQVVVLADTIDPQIEVTYDNKQIISGDFVAQQPVILINVHDNSPAVIEGDTSRIHLLLDGERINYFNNDQVISLLSLSNSSDSTLKAILKFIPQLSDGEHTLEIFVKDASDNLTYQRENFKVVNDLKIVNAFNYPNPFYDNTNFTFHLTQPVENVIIKIFTTAGRLIHRFESFDCNAGFNKICWDGRDMDGDILANGVYLYKIIAKSENEQVEKIEKLVVMR